MDFNLTEYHKKNIGCLSNYNFYDGGCLRLVFPYLFFYCVDAHSTRRNQHKYILNCRIAPGMETERVKSSGRPREDIRTACWIVSFVNCIQFGWFYGRVVSIYDL